MLYLVAGTWIIFHRVYYGERVIQFSHTIVMKHIIYFVILHLSDYVKELGDAWIHVNYQGKGVFNGRSLAEGRNGRRFYGQ